MPGERVSMRKIREVLRLRFAQGLSQRAIGSSLRLSTGAVNACLNRARRVGLGFGHCPRGSTTTSSRRCFIRRRLQSLLNSAQFRTGRWCTASCGDRT
jgi:hypothetical protein